MSHAAPDNFTCLMAALTDGQEWCKLSARSALSTFFLRLHLPCLRLWRPQLEPSTLSNPSPCIAPDNFTCLMAKSGASCQPGQLLRDIFPACSLQTGSPTSVLVRSVDASLQLCSALLLKTGSGLMFREDECYVEVSLQTKSCNRKTSIKIQLQKGGVLLWRRPFGSRVAETLLRRLEALIDEASDQETTRALQQVALLFSPIKACQDALSRHRTPLADRPCSTAAAAQHCTDHSCTQ